MGGRPIGDYALLSDRHSAALVSSDGSVDWLCFPRFDSRSLLAALLDDRAGHWSIRPAGPATSARRYVEGTMVLETRFMTDGGAVVLTDALVTGPCRDPHRIGAEAPHLLVRSLTCTRGEVEIAVEFSPRPEYGLVVPLLTPLDGGMSARGGPDLVTLSSPVEVTLDRRAATGRATARIATGETWWFGLHWAPLTRPSARVWSQEELAEQLAGTVDAWQEWSAAHENYDGPWRDLVQHSGRVLEALSYQPTGAIVAAPTTSLPEVVGGGRNWDYRYTWVRDAAFTMDALWVAACPDEAHEFFEFMTNATATQPRAHLQIMYGIGGEHDLTERELPHLSGWRASRPVRAGNSAWRQAQLDVYGELLSTAGRFADQIDRADQSLCDFLAGLADTAARVWRQPDHGIWEVRGRPRHFLYSKLMCWLALDRAVALADRLGAADRVDSWVRSRDEIRAAILRESWSDRAGAYTQYFGSDALDASALMMAIVGFLPPHDERLRATVEAVARRLASPRGLVYRYRDLSTMDGGGREGAFLLCSFWLAEALAILGEVGRARDVFERAAEHVNDVGLLAEEVDPDSGALLGNFPQAFSHIGLVNAAWAINQAERGELARPASPGQSCQLPQQCP
jgi:alpha,alpha-trehalase